MNTEHTPGPWHVGNGSFVISDYPAPGIIGSDDVHHYGGHLICESVSQANACLIAAAPDLLAALKGFVLAFELTGKRLVSLSGKPTTYDKAVAAIAKAEGKA